MRSLLQRGVLVLAGVVGLLGTRPATANAQKALVYCPVTIDATGCNAIVSALTGPAYPLGVDRGYDGTGGTVDLKAVDLFAYSVFVVPSLADGATSEPYAKLRDPEVAEHLKAALIGRLAMWSGSPDQGATNRAMKDALIQNLAGWAAAAFATAKGPGLVALLDASSSTATRYDWVRAITPVPVTSDPNLLIYSSVRSLNARATSILTSGAGTIAYDNMATFGFQVPNGAPGVSLDAVGQTGTTQGGQVVLLTMEAGNTSGALVMTDRNDYAPGETVTITGSGWQPGETIKLSLHMDPLRDSDTELTATVDANGNFTNTDFAPAEYDLRVRFVLTAIGQASGRRAQTTFTDSRTITSATLNGATSVTVSGGESITAVVNVTTDNGGGNANWRSTGWRISTTAPGTVTCVNHNDHDGAGNYSETFAITAPAGASLNNAYFIAYSNDTCTQQPSATLTLSNGVNVLDNATITSISPNTKAYGDAGFSLVVTGTNFTGTSVVRFNGSDRATTFDSQTQLTATILASDLLAVGTFPITVRNGAGAISNAVNLTVTQKTITGNFTASNKVYDGTTSATILTRTLTGVVGTDVVNLTGGTATFSDKNAGTGKTVTGTGFTLTGAQAANYVLASTTLTTTADITAATVTGAFTAQNKVYDGTTAATIATRTLTGVISPDVVTLTGGTATFANKNVGTGKTVTGVGFTLGSADAGNYVLASTTLTTTADITSRPLVVTGTGVNKVYDGTTAATVTLSDDRVAGDVFTATYTSATFIDKNVGIGKTINVVGIAITGTDAANYTANTTCSATADITAKSVTGSFTANNKVYDGTNAATVNTRSLTGTISGDDVSLTGGTATFADKNVGNAKTVTLTGAVLSGADAGNYTLTSVATATADITARALLISATGVNKVYDGTTAATVTLSDDRVSGDVFTDSYTTATFADKNVGTGKTVSVSGMSIAGADAGNYTFNTTASTTADITARALTITATGVNKVYDGTTNATVTLSDNRVAGDVFTDSYTSASFADKNVGTGKTVSVSGISISGADAGNYTFNTTATATANITARALAVTATGVNKVYDGTTAATVTFSDDRVAGDVFTVSGSASFADKNVGTGKPVTVTGIALSGADAGNYTPNTSTSTTADITQRTLTITATGVNKVYDATTAATVTLSDDRIAGDIFTDSYTSALFADKNVGTGKSISVTGISISGGDAGNYTFNTTATATANITAKALVVTATAQDKTYDGTDAATVSLADDRISGDVFTVNYTTATFSDKNVGAGKTVTVSGLSLSGADAGNYTPNATAVTTASITQRALTITATGQNKVYDGTAAATVTLADDRVAGDVFTDSYTTATFNDKNVGTAKPISVSGISISGADAGNYTFNTTANTTADITQKSITGNFTADNKVYDGNTSATVVTRTLNGAVLGDDVSLTGGTATFDTKHVGTGKTVTLTGAALSGADAGNYLLSSVATATANITARALTITATGVNKVYDGTAAATVTLADDRVSGDVFTDSYTSATFNNKNVGTGKPISVLGLSISGADAGNYTFNTTASASADITPRALTVSATGQNKVYDGTTAATVTLSDDRVAGDVLTTAYASATFSDKNVGTGKTVTATGISVTGADAGNYTFNTSTTTTADITARQLVISATGVNKVYDGTATATVTLSDDRVSGDVFTASYAAASFNNKNVGTGKPVSVTGISISGTDAGNYTFNTSANTTADITARALTITATGVNKVYDGTTAATVTLSDDRVAGDVFTDSYTSATFNDKNVGTAKPVSVSGIAISGADAGNYTFNTTANTTADITAKSITGSFTADNKVYDGTTAAAVLTRSLSGTISGDDVSLTGGTATFADKNVGTGKTVTLAGASLSGTDAGNYFLSSVATATADITARPLTITATGVNKVYDGTTAATVTLSDNRVAGDNLTTAYTSASFADKNVGTGKAVSVSGISLTGGDAGNYTFNTSANTTADITARALTITATGVNKVYDGTTAATVTLSDDRVAGDVFTDSYTTANFNNKNVGPGKPVSVSGISISGTDAGNYTFNTTANTTADITARSLVVTATGVNKVYDGTTAATVTFSDDRVSGDVFTVSGSASFADKNVGTGKTVSVSGLALSGADAANYSHNTTANTTADITQRALTVTATGINKEYDGTTVATVTLSDNRVAGDVLITAYGSAAFADPNVGTAKPVSVSGISVTGADAVNYTFNTSASTTADITRKALTIKADDKSHVFNSAVFPGPYTATFTGLVPTDQTGGQPNAGVVTGLAYTGAAITAINGGTYPIVPSGATATNYTISPVNGTLTILDQSAPIVSAVAATPNPVAMGNAFVLSANISDVATGNSNITVAEYSTNGGSTWAPMNSFTAAPSVNVTKTLTLATGVYNVCVRGTDYPGNTSVLTVNSCTLVAVYDPTAGFVTGGGWIMSPKGAYLPNLNLEGKATFGFVSKYQKGQVKPTGSTEFQFHAAGMNFKSVDYEWLVISGTTRAQYKGTGTINGAGNYGFLLSAIDGDNYGAKKPDMFRIKIWDIATGNVVYDNQIGADDTADPTMIISGGSIQIQAK